MTPERAMRVCAESVFGSIAKGCGFLDGASGGRSLVVCVGGEGSLGGSWAWRGSMGCPCSGTEGHGRGVDGQEALWIET